MIEMPKPKWACPVCGENFTRRASAIRHINNLHDGSMHSISPIGYTDYLVGRQSGLYPFVPPRRSGITTRTVADSSKVDISNVKDIGLISKFKDSTSSAAATFTTPLSDPFAEAVRNFLEVRNLMQNLMQYTSIVPPIMNGINAVPADIRINKPVGIRANLCTLCLSGSVEPVWKFVEDGTLTKVYHTCEAEEIQRIKNLRCEVEETQRTSLEQSFRVLTECVDLWLGQDEIFLKAVELPPNEFATGSTTKENVANEIPVIVLSYSEDLKCKDNHWAGRAIQESSKKRLTMLAGAVAITKNEVKEFLNIARATFGVFKIKMPDGSMSNFFMYIVKGLESTRVNYLQELKMPTSNNNSNHTNHGSQQIEWHELFQLVDARPQANGLMLVFRWDKLDLDLVHFKNLMPMYIPTLSGGFSASS